MAISDVETGSVVTTLGIHHGGIPVNDLDRAVRFYTSVLGWVVIGRYDSSDGEAHFTGRNTPTEVVYTENPDAGRDFDGFVRDFQGTHDGRTPSTNFARLRVGAEEMVLFQRPEPVQINTLVDNGIFHQSFHISPADMQKLIDLKNEGNSDIAFHTGPVLRWPHGRALYLWDPEGNYIELESEEDLPALYGVTR